MVNDPKSEGAHTGRQCGNKDCAGGDFHGARRGVAKLAPQRTQKTQTCTLACQKPLGPSTKAQANTTQIPITAGFAAGAGLPGPVPAGSPAAEWWAQQQAESPHLVQPASLS